MQIKHTLRANNNILRLAKKSRSSFYYFYIVQCVDVDMPPVFQAEERPNDESDSCVKHNAVESHEDKD